LSSDTAAMIARRKNVLGSAYKLFYDEPVHIVRGEGVWLYDNDGRKFLDMYNNVPHVGHCHPHVVEALTRQVRTLNTHTRYLHGGVLEYAERLTGKFADELDTVMFSCTGSEANELALRIARACTGGTGLIVTDYAYHGNTKAIFEISTEDIAPEDIPDFVVTVPSPDTYRGMYRDEDAAEKYASHIDTAIETLQSRGIKPAAFVIDTIVSSAGIVTPPAGYLRKAADRIRAAGGLFVADEVQPGFGRMGTHFWGYEADDLVPDIVTMGKPMGNGHPMAATVTRAELIDQFSERAHYFNTFGGSPVSCAAGMAVLQVIEKEQLQQNALAVGQYLTDGLNDMATRYEAIGDVRGSGFFKSVELVTDRESCEPATELAARVINGLRERQVLAGRIGKDENILKLRPPMVFTQENADHFLNTLDDVFSAT
jgi:4-aminobutyrate aminotransferase-like enzyme